MAGSDRLADALEELVGRETVPRDEFSRRFRELTDNPGAVRRDSAIDVPDFYGNLVSWRVTTFRADSVETVFLQRQDGNGGARWVLPPEVTAAIARQRDGAVSAGRSKAARQGLETRRAAGQRIGNPEALAKARRARRKK